MLSHVFKRFHMFSQGFWHSINRFKRFPHVFCLKFAAHSLASLRLREQENLRRQSHAIHRGLDDGPMGRAIAVSVSRCDGVCGGTEQNIGTLKYRYKDPVLLTSLDISSYLLNLLNVSF